MDELKPIWKTVLNMTIFSYPQLPKKNIAELRDKLSDMIEIQYTIRYPYWPKGWNIDYKPMWNKYAYLLLHYCLSLKAGERILSQPLFWQNPAKELYRGL